MYYKYSDYLKGKYGEKVYKIPVNLPLSCPNRDGTKGVGGCIFCAEYGTGADNLPADLPVARQIEENIAYIGKRYGSRKFIVYFQNYSNTYLPLADFRKILRQIPRRDDIVGVSVSTRPDLVRDDYLDALCALPYDASLELGLQTVNYHTLRRINRGHSLAEFIDAVLQAKAKGCEVCAHVILNLPWDTMEDTVECAKVLSALQVDRVKIHSLHILGETKLGEMYARGEFTLCSREEYIDRVIAFLEYLSPRIAVERLVSRAPKEGSLLVNWGTGSFRLVEMIEEEMARRGSMQGDRCDYLGGALLGKFD